MILNRNYTHNGCYGNILNGASALKDVGNDVKLHSVTPSTKLRPLSNIGGNEENTSRRKIVNINNINIYEVLVVGRHVFPPHHDNGGPNLLGHSADSLHLKGSTNRGCKWSRA